MTEPGTIAEEAFEDSEIPIPPEGAGLDSVTVPVTAVVALPLTEAGETESEVRVGAVMFRLVD